jgi:hypothetical protein
VAPRARGLQVGQAVVVAALDVVDLGGHALAAIVPPDAAAPTVTSQDGGHDLGGPVHRQACPAIGPFPSTGHVRHPPCMGFKEFMANAAAATPVAKFEDVTLYRDRVTKGGALAPESHPLAGVSCSIESGSQLDKRLTATRLALLGPAAVFVKKSKGGESYLTIEGPEFVWLVKVDRGERTQRKAREFAAKVATQVKQAEAEMRKPGA